MRHKNQQKFRQDYPEFKSLRNDQIQFIFKSYKASIDRSVDTQNISMLVSGTLIILISCLFMNGGAAGEIVMVDERNAPNNIVMNTVIASASSGLTMMLMN